MNLKRCSKCGIEKPLTDFYQDKRRGIPFPCCKICYCATAKKWRQANKEKTRAYCRNHYWNDIEKSRERVRIASRLRPKEIKKLILNIWRKKNPEKNAVYIQNREARKNKNGGVITSQEWKELKERYNNTCLCCGRNDVKLTMDHVIPLMVGGRNSIENIQPLCLTCNDSKGRKTIDYRRIKP